MNTSKIRVFYARLEISAFLQPLEQLLGVGFLDLTKQSASGEKLSENLSAGQTLNRPPLSLKKQNRERVRLKSSIVDHWVEEKRVTDYLLRNAKYR